MAYKGQLYISPDFFKGEYRDGYYVSEKMKKVWAVELDLVAKFVEICEKNNLEYFLDGGTLLGAVRHKGFIPWDDDIDILMPRKDYNILFEIAEKEFTYPYFFQTTLSEEGFFRAHAQLRNSETTGFIELDGRTEGINKGIFIDIFPLDGIPDSSWQQWLFKKQLSIEKKMMSCQCYTKYSEASLKRKIIYVFVHFFFKIYPYKRFFKRFNLNSLSRYSNKNTKLIGDITLGWRKNVQWERKWFSGYSYLRFENLKLKAPLFYKEVLERQYGDFMKFPEDVHAAGGNIHGKVTFEPEIPYKEYCKLH